MKLYTKGQFNDLPGWWWFCLGILFMGSINAITIFFARGGLK